MPSIRSLVVLTSLACTALIAFLLLGIPVAPGISKMLASSAFVAVAIRGGATRSPFGRLVLLGLLLSWCGDAFLIGDSRNAFLLGLSAFLLAHLSYIGAFVARGISLGWFTCTALPVTSVAIAVSWWLTPHLAPDLNVAVRVYTVVISIMLVSAAGTHGREPSPHIIGGAALFFLSDLSVAALRIVETDFPTYVWGLPLYYGGQVLLALGASQSRSH